MTEIAVDWFRGIAVIALMPTMRAVNMLNLLDLACAFLNLSRRSKV